MDPVELGGLVVAFVGGNVMHSCNDGRGRVACCVRKSESISLEPATSDSVRLPVCGGREGKGVVSGGVVRVVSGGVVEW